MLRTLGGCGGTLAARVLGALPGVVLLSECNPRSATLHDGALNPLVQLRAWRPALVADETVEPEALADPDVFGDFLVRLHGRVVADGGRLVVRDYGYVDFIGVPFADPPPRDSSLDAALAGRFAAQDALLVRRPVDQTASLLQHEALADVLKPRHVLDGYSALLDSRPDLPIVRYEDLVASPDEAFEAMCAAMGLSFDPAALGDLSMARQVTGNLTRIDQPISPPEPTPRTVAMRAAFAREPDHAQLLARLGYT